MQTIKTACFNHINYCKFPKGIDTIGDFVAFLNENYHAFVELEVFLEEGCAAPFFIEGKTETHYWNPSLMRVVREAEIYILEKEEYDAKLKEVITEKCTQCVHYSENVCEEDLASHREHINLNGECYGFEKKR